jgi:hypothetical protein
LAVLVASNNALSSGDKEARKFLAESLTKCTIAG